MNNENIIIEPGMLLDNETMVLLSLISVVENTNKGSIVMGVWAPLMLEHGDPFLFTWNRAKWSIGDLQVIR